MKQTTFLSLSLGPWSLSFGIHLVFFLTLFFVGRNHFLDLAVIELEFAPSSKIPMAPRQPPQEEEWQKPQALKHPIIPPPPKPQPKPEPAPVPAPVSTGQAGEAGTGAFRSIAQVSQLPRFINEVKPQFPEAAKDADITGVVILQVDIDATGAVKMVGLIQGLGYGCDEAAITALKQSAFTPAYHGNQPVPLKGLTVRYRFKWND